MVIVVVVVVMVVAVLWLVLCLSGIYQVVRVPVHTRQEWLYSVGHRAVCKCYYIKILLWRYGIEVQAFRSNVQQLETNRTHKALS
jgi:hypothetical protein